MVSTPRILWVIVRGWNRNFGESFRKFIEELTPNSKAILPDLPLDLMDSHKPEDIAVVLNKAINEEFSSDQYHEVRLIGFSAGAPILRYVYAKALGVSGDGLNDLEADPWSLKVTRIVYLSGILRGWEFNSAMPLFFRLIFPHLMRFLWMAGWAKNRRKLGIYGLRRHSAFISSSRLLDIQRLNLQRDRGLTLPREVHLLGSKDEFISPMDCLNVAGSDETIFIELPNVDHADMFNAHTWRREGEAFIKFKWALIGSKTCQSNCASRSLRDSCAICTSDSQRYSISQDDINDYHDPLDRPIHLDAAKNRDKIRHAVIVLHGIRDQGFWTKRVAKEIKERVRRCPEDTACIDVDQRVIDTRAPSPGYGYFSIRDFVCPRKRQRQAMWLLSQYTDIRETFPRADISFVGHSNGTYLAAHILKQCQEVRFRNIYFAGSVVRRDYHWQQVQDRIKGKVLNVTSKADWVLSAGPALFERLRLHRILDLGSGGLLGFRFSKAENHRFRNVQIEGGHSAGISEAKWQGIAKFVVDGEFQADQKDDQFEAIGPFCRYLVPAVTLALLTVLLLFLGYLLCLTFKDFVCLMFRSGFDLKSAFLDVNFGWGIIMAVYVWFVLWITEFF